jgi:aryl-alcohol dehydrogenase-like predicted oxidoreductase
VARSITTISTVQTATQAHLEANLAAAALHLDQDEIDAITAAVSKT